MPAAPFRLTAPGVEPHPARARAPPIPAASKVEAVTAALGRPILPDMAALTARSNHLSLRAAVAAMAVAAALLRVAARAEERSGSPSPARWPSTASLGQRQKWRRQQRWRVGRQPLDHRRHPCRIRNNFRQRRLRQRARRWGRRRSHFLGIHDQCLYRTGLGLWQRRIRVRWGRNDLHQGQQPVRGTIAGGQWRSVRYEHTVIQCLRHAFIAFQSHHRKWRCGLPTNDLPGIEQPHCRSRWICHQFVRPVEPGPAGLGELEHRRGWGH